MPGALNGKVVAVTGAAGFIGGRLAERLAADGCAVMRVDRSNDVTERPVWDRIVDADVIIHLAAQTSVAVANADPARDFAANVMPMRHLLAACRDRRRAPTVLFAGTVTQAGVPSSLPVNEDALDHPITVYDRHKLTAEHELTAAAVRGDAIGVTLRLANVYGPGSHRRRSDRDVLNRMIAAALDGQSLRVYGSGAQVRDYVFVEDVVDAFVMAAAHAERLNAGHFVVGSGHGVSIRDAFELVAARVGYATGRAVEVRPVEPDSPLSEIERRNFIADHSRFSAATGWRPRVSLCDGIDRTIASLTCA